MLVIHLLTVCNYRPRHLRFLEQRNQTNVKAKFAFIESIELQVSSNWVGPSTFLQLKPPIC